MAVTIRRLSGPPGRPWRAGAALLFRVTTERGQAADQFRLPGQEDRVDPLRCPCDLCELGAVCDQGRVELELGGEGVAIGLELVLQRELLHAERLVIRVALAPGQRLRIAGKTGAHGDGERGCETGVPADRNERRVGKEGRSRW